MTTKLGEIVTADEMSNHVSGPVFSKERNFRQTKDIRSLKSKPLIQPELNIPLRAPSLEGSLTLENKKIVIQLSEAKKSLNILLTEMVAYLPENRHGYLDSNIDLIEAITNVSLICRTLMHENDNIKRNMAALGEDMNDQEVQFQKKIRELEERVLSCNRDRQELVVSHSVEHRQLREEAKQLKHQVEELTSRVMCVESEKSSIRKKYKEVQHLLLEQPRIEEKYFKKAKMDVRHKEMSLNRRESKWKK